MLMASWAMHMSVCNFFCARITYLYYFNFVIERASCKRMIEVDVGIELTYFCDHHAAHPAVGLYRRNHAGRELGDALLQLQVFNWYTLNSIWLPRPVSFFGP